MLRLVADDSGGLWPDLSQQAPGRGVYLCMQPDCIKRLGARHLKSLQAKFPALRTDVRGLWDRLEKALVQSLRQLIQRLAPQAALGRDAVMHRMWNNSPMLVLLAADAGEALRRQIHHAVEKRQASGGFVQVVLLPASSWMGQILGRERLAVMALERKGLAKKMELYARWYSCLKELGKETND